MRIADEVRISRQFKSYSGCQEDIKALDYVYAAVLPTITNSHKLVIKWSGPLTVQRLLNNTIKNFESENQESMWPTEQSLGLLSAMVRRTATKVFSSFFQGLH